MSVVTNLTQNRRMQARVNTDLAVRFRLKNSTHTQNSLARDLSRGGLRLVTNNVLPKETSILLSLELKELPQILNIAGRVAWVKDVGYANYHHMGIEFKDVNRKMQNTLDEYLGVKRITDYGRRS